MYAQDILAFTGDVDSRVYGKQNLITPLTNKQSLIIETPPVIPKTLRVDRDAVLTRVVVGLIESPVCEIHERPIRCPVVLPLYSPVFSSDPKIDCGRNGHL